MRILNISDFAPPVLGGREAHVSRLAAALAERGNDVIVATLTRRPFPIDAVTSVSLPSAARWLPHEDASRPFPLPMPDPITRRSIKQIVDRFSPDVVHIHGWTGASVPRELVCPVVLTAHDYQLICARRTLLRMGATICDGPRRNPCLRCTSTALGSVRAAALVAGTNYGRRRLHVDAVIAVSDSVRQVLLPYVDAPIEVIENFAPAPTEPSDLAAVPEADLVVFAGDPSPHKGLPMLLEAWRDRAPAMRLLAAVTRPLTNTVPPGVSTVTVPASDMQTLWQRATVAVVPSLWADPCPGVVLESMACGTPVVASAVGGIRELVRDGIDGYLVPPQRPDLLVERLATIVGDPVLRARMGESALIRASTFSLHNGVQRTEALYERVIRERRSRSHES